jgi:hypothetical protein
MTSHSTRTNSLAPTNQEEKEDALAGVDDPDRIFDESNQPNHNDDLDNDDANQ